MNHAEQLRQLRAKATAGEWWRTEPPWGYGTTVHAGPSDDPHTATCYVADGDCPCESLQSKEVEYNMAFIAYAANNALAIADALDAKDAEIARLETENARLREQLAAVTAQVTGLDDLASDAY